MEMSAEISNEANAIAVTKAALKDFKSRSQPYENYCAYILKFATRKNYPILVDQMITCIEKSYFFSRKVPKNFIKDSFFIAVENHNIPLVMRFLQARKDLVRIGKYMDYADNDHTRVFYGYKTALDIAAESGDLALAQVLVQAGDDPNHAGQNYDRDEVKPLIEAAHNNDLKAIQVLLAVGADPDILQSHLYKICFEKEKSFLIDSFNALMEAARHRNCDAVEIFVEGVEYPPNLFTNLMLELQKQKKKTYFSLLPSDLFLPCAKYLAPHFKIQADLNVRSLMQGKTPLDLIIPDRRISISKDERARLGKVVALLRSKRGIKIEKPAITLKELYNLPSHKS